MRSSLLAAALTCVLPATAHADERVAVVPPFAEPDESGFETLASETLVHSYAVSSVPGVTHASCGDDGAGRCLSVVTRAELVLGPALLAAGVTWRLRAPWARRSKRLQAVPPS
jgi:hypothetical protein